MHGMLLRGMESTSLMRCTQLSCENTHTHTWENDPYHPRIHTDGSGGLKFKYVYSNILLTDSAYVTFDVTYTY